jgi:hypothetical protein
MSKMYSTSGGSRFFLKALPGRSSVFARRLSHTATASKFSLVYSKPNQRFFRIQQKFHFKGRCKDFWIREYTTKMNLKPTKTKGKMSDEEWNKLFVQGQQSVHSFEPIFHCSIPQIFCCFQTPNIFEEVFSFLR